MQTSWQRGIGCMQGAALVVVLALAGCASSKGNQPAKVEPPEPVPKYQAVLIEPVEIKMPQPAPADAQAAQEEGKRLQAMLGEVVSKRFARKNFKVLTRQPGADDKAAVIKTQVDFDPGNRALRWIVGFGAGKASATVHMSATDPLMGGKELVAKTDSDKLRMGLFGGDSDKLLRGAVDDVAKNVAGDLEDITEPASATTAAEAK